MRSGGHLLRMARKIFVRFSIARAIHVMVSGLMIGITGPTLAQQTSLPSPVVLNAEQDHRRLLDLLKISKLRPGANPRNTDPASQPNYDESKANPYPNLPDPLTLKNGRKEKNAKMWWTKRRPEIVEDFDREIYGG